MKPFKDIFLKSANTKDAEPQKKQKKKIPKTPVVKFSLRSKGKIWGFLSPVTVWSLTVVNGVSLQSIQLKEAVFDRHVADKMERFHCTNRTDAILLLRQVPRLRSPWKHKQIKETFFVFLSAWHSTT